MLPTQRQSFTCLLIILLFGLTSCLGGGRAPVSSRGGQQSASVEKRPVAEKIIPGSAGSVRITDPILHKDFYKVVRGDTLYSIAWRYKLDYKKLARWNAIRTPYVIHIGKKLRLTPLPEKPVQIATKVKNPGPYPKPTEVFKKPVPKSNPKTPTIVKQAPTIKPTPGLPAKIGSWQWPAKGKLISSNTVSSRNGIDIKGKMGQTVKAAAAGNVVYSGHGLVGYGNLIIIKHNKTFLSAYAHNSRLLVIEGAKVGAGQPIAEMGNSGTNMVKLHFEIRKDGKSVDPLKYLSN
jgi:lipoprotein NlpD